MLLTLISTLATLVMAAQPAAVPAGPAGWQVNHNLNLHVSTLDVGPAK